MDKIKVVIVINSFLVGGAERLTSDILSRIDRNRFDASLVTLFQFDDRETMYHLLPAGMVVHKLRFGGFADLGSWVRLVRVLRAERPSVVLSNLFFSNTATRIVGLFLGFRTITVEHNTYNDRTRMQTLCDRLLSYVTARIVAVSPVVMDFTAQKEGISPHKFVVIPNGVDIESIERRAKQADALHVKKELGISADSRIIVSVGRMTAQKNFKLLIDGFVLFARARPEYHLVILGGGGLLEEIQHSAQKTDATRRIHVPGNRKDVVPYLCASEFFTSTSSIEGLSIAHLEALVCGLPLLATRTASSLALISPGVNGFFIDDASASAVAQGLEKMAAADIEVLRGAARKVAQSHDIGKMVVQYEELIAEVAR